MLTARQLRGWQRYYDAEPWGAKHEELLHGIRASLLANMWCSAGGLSTPEDWMPSYNPLEHPDSPAVIFDGIRMARAMANERARQKPN